MTLHDMTTSRRHETTWTCIQLTYLNATQHVYDGVMMLLLARHTRRSTAAHCQECYDKFLQTIADNNSSSSSNKGTAKRTRQDTYVIYVRKIDNPANLTNGAASNCATADGGSCGTGSAVDDCIMNDGSMNGSEEPDDDKADDSYHVREPEWQRTDVGARVASGRGVAM